MNDSEQRKRDRTDMQRIARLILSSPIADTKTVKVDGELSIDKFKNANTDVRTRMLLQISMDAMRGDIKAAEFMVKVAGLEQPKETEVSFNMPTMIIDDLSGSDDIIEQPPEVKALPNGEKEDVITDDEDIPVIRTD